MIVKKISDETKKLLDLDQINTKYYYEPDFGPESSYIVATVDDFTKRLDRLERMINMLLEKKND